MTDLTNDYLGRYDSSLMHSFGKPKAVFARGKGVELWDVDGKHYIDMFSGIAVGGLGHAHPLVAEAVYQQMMTLGHISNLYTSQPQIKLAEKLAKLVSADGEPVRVYFSNSGAESNEAAFKLTRLTRRTKIIAMEGGFHGRTMGALSITGTAKYRQPFAPLPGDVTFVEYGNFDQLESAIDDQTAAVVVEPIQGEQGVIVPPQGYLSRVRELTSQYGALLWVDEVQTGIGRCGEWFISVADAIKPDIITLAKGLGNGFPIGACIGIGKTAELFTPGSHGSTFSGNPPAAAAALAVLDVIESDGLLDRAKQAGQFLAEAIRQLNHPLIDCVRGRGLLLAIQLKDDFASQLSDELLKAGWITNAARPAIIRLAPPLIITDNQLARFVEALNKALDKIVVS